MYCRVDADIRDELIGIVGEKNVLTEQDVMEPYSHDEVPELSAWPEIVVRAGSMEDVAAVMRLASNYHIPVTPRGGGQGLSGGAVPLHGGIVLSLERMNRVIEIDHQNLMVTVEPGVITGDLHRAVEAEGFLYPPDPASLDSCLIGGNIAENAGGPRAVKYGVTKDYVCGLEVVLASGEVIDLGGKLVKDVAGYNLMQLIVGSEGTLGIVTKIILRLVPLPKAQIDLLVPYEEFQHAADTVAAIIAEAIVPTTIEFMERDVVKASENLLQKEVPFSDATAQLLIQLSGVSAEQLEDDLDRVGEICLDHGAIDVLVAQDRPTRERLWEARRMIIEALNHESPINHTEDVSVPRSEIPTLLRDIHALGDKVELNVLCFGHAGDGNVHVNVLKRDMPQEVWDERIPEFQTALYNLAISLGGTITGEHGVGAIRKEHLAKILSLPELAIMRGIKNVFDPAGILNPGKILA